MKTVLYQENCLFIWKKGKLIYINLWKLTEPINVLRVSYALSSDGIIVALIIYTQLPVKYLDILVKFSPVQL